MLDAHWVEQAVRLAADNVAAGGGPFGALIVRDGAVLAHGANQVTSTLDPTAHAEVVAIRAACRALGSFSLDGCLLVSSCEPCPLCLSAAMWSRLDRIVFGADRHAAAEAGFDDRAFYDVFTVPDAAWPLAVEHVPGVDSARPFAAWQAHPARVAY